MKYLATISKLMFGVLMLFALSATSLFGQTILENDLRSGTAPADWTATDIDFRDSAGGYALFDAATSELESPSFDLSGLSSATLTFQVAQFGQGDAGPLTVEVSTDGGTTWDAQTYTSPTPTDSDYLEGEMVFDSAVLGEADVRVRFNRPDSPSAKRLRDVLVVGPDGITLPTPTEVATIAELRNGTADGETRYRLTGEALVHFTDSFRGRRMLVDGTAGIWSVDLNDSFSGGTNVGDGITGLEGTLNLTNSGGLLRFELDAGAANATVSSTGNTIDPETTTIPNLSLDDTGKLVLIEGVTFQETGEFSTGTNYTLEDGDGNTLTFRTDYFGADYIGEPIPTAALNVTGVVGGFGSSAQIFARSSADLDQQGAGLQIIHNSPDPAVSSVDIFVNGESFLTDVAFRSATNFMSVPAGVDLSIEIAPAGQGIEAALDPITVNLTDDENYIAVASGVLNTGDFTYADGDPSNKGFSLEVFTPAQTQATDPAKVDLLVQHGSPDTPAVDIYLEQTGDMTPAISGLTYPDFAGYTPIDPNNELITVAVANGDPVTSFAAPLADLDAGGAAITVLASGFFLEANQTDNNALALIAVLADGSVLTLEEFSLTESIDYANLQFPPTADITTTETVDVYGQVYAEGITEADGAPAGMSAWVGVSSTDTNPATWAEESWTEATYNVQSGNNDEYVAAIGSGLAPGTYYYATRFRYEQEQYVYGGYTDQGGNFWEEGVNVSGVLTVTPASATIAEARAAELGSFFEVTGVVTSPDFGFGVADYFVQDATAGINVTDFDTGGAQSGVVVAPGDSIRIVGETAEFRNQQNIEVIEFEIINSGNPLPEPQVITAAEFTADSDLQGSRVLLENVTLTEASEANWPTDPIDSGSGVNVTFENSSGETFIVRLARNNTFFSSGTPAPTGPVNITGSLGQFDDDTQLFPFFDGDITPAPTQVQIIHNSADPAVASVDIYVDGTLTLEDVDFRTATTFIELPSNTAIDIGITPADQPLSSGVTFQNNFFDPGNYYVVASGVIDPSGFEANPSGEEIDLELFVIPNAETSAPDENTFSFRIHHGVTDAPAVDISARGVTSLATDVVYGTTTADYVDVDAALYTIDVAPAGGSVIASFEADANALGGQSALVLASGFLTPDNDQNGEPFGALLVLADGTTALLPGVSTSIDELDGMPQEFALEQNYPNPFNPTTQIEFALPQAADVQIAVYNIVGQRVATLLSNEQKSAGFHSVTFDASNLASGMYMYRIQAGNFTQTRKMTLIK